MKQQRVRFEDDSKSVRAVIDSMGEGLIAVDAEGMITAVNPYALKALGLKENEMLGQWFSGLVVAVDQHRKPIDDLMRPIIRALTLGEAVSDYIYYLKQDGTMMPVFVTVSPIIINGRPQGAIELFRDITSDQQLDIAKDEFVSLASHQLRTPASGVGAILSMLAAGDFGAMTELQQKQVRRAIEGNNRQLQIIEDILHAARIDAGKMELQIEQVELVELIEGALRDQVPAFERRQQTVSFAHADKLAVWADVSKLCMVLDNILSNASKYTLPSGRIEVALGSTDDTAIISVSDNGVGIAAQDIPRLFAKFARVDNELSTLVGGTGLGLYLANNIVKLHRGSMSVKSHPSKGSTFYITLPRRLG